MSYEVIIVGAGPGGLSCAALTASHGFKTLVLERKKIIGPKVCAGGVTWNGLVKTVSDDIWERQFATQHICTRYQQAKISAKTPIIATVNRAKLGEQMASKAQQAGVEIRLGCQVTAINGNELTFCNKTTGLVERKKFTFLVGADGSSSFVRRHLGIPVQQMGIGINYQLAGSYPRMEWHFDSTLFASGYAWVFPHQETVSVGAYADARVIKAKTLQKNLISWGVKSGYQLGTGKSQAEFINYDFRGWRFNNIFLVGDAAGLASGLTGEGIYPAIVSGKAVANCIINPHFMPHTLTKLIRNHGRHRRLVSILGSNRFCSTFLAELITFSLRKNLISFSAVEMAH